MQRRGGQHPLPADWKKIQDYCCAKGGRPNYKEAQKIMDEFIENMKLEHCTINYDAIRISAKHPDIDLPGVGYDMFLEDGSRYYGSWEMSNYLDFRLEDHTKLVWATTKQYPYPPFGHYEDPNVVRYDPLTDLAFELNEGEFANYTVREVERPCGVTLVAGGAGAVVRASCNGVDLGVFEVPAADVLEPAVSNTLTIPAGEEAVVRLTVLSGMIQIKTVRFAYC